MSDMMDKIMAHGQKQVEQRSDLREKEKRSMGRTNGSRAAILTRLWLSSASTEPSSAGRLRISLHTRGYLLSGSSPSGILDGKRRWILCGRDSRSDI